MKGFMNFIREQGVVGLAVGFILGGAVSKVVTSLVDDVINPILGLILGNADGLKKSVVSVGDADVLLGNFITTLIDFSVIALVVYIGVKKLGLDKMDKSAE